MKPQEVIELEKVLGFELEELYNLEDIIISHSKCYLLDEQNKIIGLNLNGLKSEDISFLQGFKNLTSLKLSNNEISDYSVLKDLTNLTSLKLSNNEISDYSVLTNLTHLNIEYNEISDHSVLQDLTNLTHLNLKYNQISDISFLQNLTNLTDLNLEDNEISDISFLQNLTNLTDLNLGENQISDISFLQNLTNLTDLNLGENQISDISFLKGLINLIDLRLRDNEISDISFLQDLTNLTNLDLRFNQISDISFLQSLTNLTDLNLEDNEISDISFLKGLINLTSLNLSFNQISNISFLKGLINLTFLNLDGNQISNISFLKGLINLTFLNLYFNEISNISLDFLNSLPKLEKLTLRNNPISNIPKEIFSNYENALQPVRNYLEDIKTNPIPNNEVKIIFIGNGSVGKTQVAKRLVEKEDFEFDTQHNSTHAIQLLQTKIDCTLFEKEGLLLNIWDFGGQDLFHATHRLFMQTKAIFVLVWDAENEKNEYHEWEGKQYKNEKLRYWLEYSHFFGKESPILVVQNKIDDPEHAKNEMPAPEQKEYQKVFPNIAKFIKASAKKGNGFDVICNSIEVLLEKNETLRKDVKENLPTSWVNIRKRVREEQAKENGLKKISKADFTAWCEAEDVVKTTDTILDYLYHTGVLYYNEHLFLGEIILDQAWLIEAIYKILDRQGAYAEILEGNEGQLEYRDLKKIWKDNDDKERHNFMFYMLNAELCFETTKKTKNNDTPLKDRTFVVPQLLSAEKPNYIEDYANENKLTEQNQIQYKFLPTVFMYRFIIRAKDLADIADMWQSGIYLHYEGQYAIVEANYETQQIVIRYNQAAKKDLLRVIEEEFEK